MKATLTLKGDQKRPKVPKKRPQCEKRDQNLTLLKKVIYFCTLILSTFLQNPGRLAQKCTVLKMYENLEISRTCVLNANYTII